MISTKIPSDYIDITLIRKCNSFDLPAFQSASKRFEKSLLKYLSFPGVDISYCDRISTLLDRAESWAMSMVQAYTSAEVHSIQGSPGDIADIGIFSNNADGTVFEFLESFELGYIDWGNNRHLSAIIAALQQLEKLICTNVALGAELRDCLYSRNTLTSLGKLLIIIMMSISEK